MCLGGTHSNGIVKGGESLSVRKDLSKANIIFLPETAFYRQMLGGPSFTIMQSRVHVNILATVDHDLGNPKVVLIRLANAACVYICQQRMLAKLKQYLDGTCHFPTFMILCLATIDGDWNGSFNFQDEALHAFGIAQHIPLLCNSSDLELFIIDEGLVNHADGRLSAFSKTGLTVNIRESPS